MKYAVVYLSDTGNTKNLAKEIYVSLSGDEKVIVDVKPNSTGILCFL